MASQMTEPEIQSALARVEQSLGEERPMDAIPDLQAILAAVPNHPGALCGIGRVSIQLGDNNAALHALNLALDQVPEMLEARNARGVAYQNLDRLTEAEADFQFVCDRLPDNPGALLNMGGLLAARGEFPAAEQYFERILSIAPDNPTAGYNLGLLHLVTGRLAEGWRGFDLRSRADNVGLAPGRSRQPGWSGENRPQGTLLIQAEQGLGDNIQFIRYAALARARVGRVIVEAPDPLTDLFSGIAGVDDVVARGHPLPPHDAQISVMSLPRVFETEIDTVPWDGAYIRPAPERVAVKPVMSGLFGPATRDTSATANAPLPFPSWRRYSMSKGWSSIRFRLGRRRRRWMRCRSVAVSGLCSARRARSRKSPPPFRHWIW